MIGISSTLFDLDGCVVLDEARDSDLSEIRRRVSRVPTLDGGVAVNDMGHSAGDRTFRVRWRITNKGNIDRVKYIVQTYGRVVVSCAEGAFLAVPSSVFENDGIGELELLIVEELS